MMKLFCAIGLSLSSMLAAASQSASPIALSAALRDQVRDERFGMVSSIRGLPLGVRDAMQAMFGNALDIAEPGAQFQVPGAPVNPALPLRRLIVAGCAAELCLVYYERGGGTHTWHVLLFRWTPAATRFEGGGTAPGGLTTIEAVRKAFLSGAVRTSARF